MKKKKSRSAVKTDSSSPKERVNFSPATTETSPLEVSIMDDFDKKWKEIDDTPYIRHLTDWLGLTTWSENYGAPTRTRLEKDDTVPLSLYNKACCVLGALLVPTFQCGMALPVTRQTKSLMHYTQP
jgi:hypothetical protein